MGLTRLIGGCGLDKSGSFSAASMFQALCQADASLFPSKVV